MDTENENQILPIDDDDLLRFQEEEDDGEEDFEEEEMEMDFEEIGDDDLFDDPYISLGIF